MVPTRLSPKSDPYVGYIGSVIIALFSSGWLGGLLVAQFGVLVGSGLMDAWSTNISAGIFLGIVAANPVDVFGGRKEVSEVPIRFFIGFTFGVIAQLLFITPFTGPGMSKYLFLLLAALGIPAGVVLRWVDAYLVRHNLDPIGKLADLVFRFLNWSDRLMFIFLMTASFTTFAYLSVAAWLVMTILGSMLFVLISSIAGRDAECESAQDFVAEDHKAWLAIDPELPAVDRKREGLARLKSIVLQLFPGAILFGGMMHLALDISLVRMPAVGISFVELDMNPQNIAILVGTGLVVFMICIIGALAAGLLFLWAVGFSQHWTRAHLREKCLHVIRFMQFRPIERYWAEEQ